ncbi:alpha/beta-hydrolase [Fistulina hepatica ATCC 64428]|uniref:Alpha/beta-hydrolase n=1 Tax=Fistulina hepatica ATCC 64428 TaxID=1128425 RepID=A0A0D7A4P9_9AGAR|nr:alpha/beta-hydrolase [Fistulina hepatica ATCC 64428]
MPFVDLHTDDDFASIYYRTNTLYSNVSGFDPNRPTIIILHPTCLDSSWVHKQFIDPRLNNGYNLIAFDRRASGRSKCRASGKHDSWVDAADLAMCHQLLQLPPSHILALEGIAVICALRFAALFPDMCLSLTLCSVPPPTEFKWVYTAFDELMATWCSAEDLESLEHSANESISFMIGSKGCDDDLQDDLITYWQLHMPPRQRARNVEALNVLLNRTALKTEVLSTITQPVLLIHGDHNDMCPIKHAEKLSSHLCNAGGGAMLYIVKGGGGLLNIAHASIVNQTFCKFLSRLPPARSDLLPLDMSIEKRMQAALKRLSEWMDDPSIARRNPVSPLSFCQLPPDVIKSQTDLLLHYGKNQALAFSPVNSYGAPLRKFSERKQDHWFHGDKNGLSIAGQVFSAQELADSPLMDEQLSSADPADAARLAQKNGRLRRATYTGNAVEKPIIKGSMAKILVQNSASPLRQLRA